VRAFARARNQKTTAKSAAPSAGTITTAITAATPPEDSEAAGSTVNVASRSWSE
jgi:hypothetical protein